MIPWLPSSCKTVLQYWILPISSVVKGFIVGSWGRTGTCIGKEEAPGYPIMDDMVGWSCAVTSQGQEIKKILLNNKAKAWMHIHWKKKKLHVKCVHLSLVHLSLALSSLQDFSWILKLFLLGTATLTCIQLLFHFPTEPKVRGRCWQPPRGAVEGQKTNKIIIIIKGGVLVI